LHQAIGAPAGLQQQQRQAIFAELWISLDQKGHEMLMQMQR